MDIFNVHLISIYHILNFYNTETSPSIIITDLLLFW